MTLYNVDFNLIFVELIDQDVQDLKKKKKDVQDKRIC